MKPFVVGVLIATATAMGGVTKAQFDKTPDGAPVDIYTLTNKHGMEAKIINFGGILVSLKAPDRNGVMADIVLGFDSLAGYRSNSSCGALIGRYGNRIAHARFKLDGVDYALAANNGENSIHGGMLGFNQKLWTGRELPNNAVELSYLSKDGEEGYPGNLKVTVVYRLTDANELKIDYSATTDKDTVLNLTNHSYFNLKGAGEGDILDHVITLHADRFTPVRAGLIPTGEIKPVDGTPFDLRMPTVIRTKIDLDDEQLKLGGGYDHNFVLKTNGNRPVLAARVEEPSTGRVLEVLTTEPGVQFYAGNGLGGKVAGKGGKLYPARGGFCLETQHFPDSPNQPGFPTTVLKAGRRFQSETVFKLSAK